MCAVVWHVHPLSVLDVWNDYVCVQVEAVRNQVVFTAALLAIILLLVMRLESTRPLGDYSDPFGPFFEASYADAPGEYTGKLRVVTWNLHHAEKLAQVIATLENAAELQNADVLLLQEVNLSGVEEISRRMKYNYIYYPAAFHGRLREEFGNAILSKWPLSDPAKIVLPNWLPRWLESRNAARATISVENSRILVYSVHLDTVWMVPVWAQTQGDFLSDVVGAESRFVIIGGDFNSWTESSIQKLEKGFEKYGLARLTQGTGYTFHWSRLKLTLDHIFSEQGMDDQSGVYRQTDASDHFPVWVNIVTGIDQ